MIVILRWVSVIATLVFLLGLVVFFTPPHARADEAHMRAYHATQQQDDWMRSLTRPDTHTSCCNLNDCGPTDAEFREGQWWATIRGKWTPIPDTKVVHNPITIDGEAWVCASEYTIFCFVPPLTSY